MIRPVGEQPKFSSSKGRREQVKHAPLADVIKFFEMKLTRPYGTYFHTYKSILYLKQTVILENRPADHFTKKRASFQSELAFSFTTVCRKLASFSKKLARFLRCFTKLLAFCDPENM